MNKKDIRIKKIASFLVAICISLFILSTSIAVPILFRPFYYIQIDSLKLEEKTGFSKEQIVEAYDQMLDYCTGRTDQFGTGDLKWSDSGKAHFTDVRGLFILDLWIMVVTAVLLLAWMIICRHFQYEPYRFFRKGPAFWGASGLLAVFAIVGTVTYINFNKVFILFHNIFFSGKDNWILNSSLDRIIDILPKRFFINCSILILLLVIIMCIFFMVTDAKKENKK